MAKLRVAQRELELVQANFDSAVKDLDGKRIAYSELDNKRLLLEDKLHECQIELGLARKRAKKHRVIEKETETELSARSTHLSSLMGELRGVVAAHDGTKAELEQYKDLARKLQEELSAAKNERDILATRLESAANQAKADELTRRAMAEAQSLLEKKCDAALAEIDELNASKNYLEGTLSSTQQKMKSTKAHVDELKSRVAQFEIKLEEMTRERNRLTDALETTQRDLALTKRERDCIETECATVKSASATLEQRCVELEARVADLQNEHNQLELDILKHKKIIDERDDEKVQLKMQLQEASEERERETLKATEYADHQMTLQKEVERARNELDWLRERQRVELLKTESQLRDKTTEVELLRNSLEEIQDERNILHDQVLKHTQICSARGGYTLKQLVHAARGGNKILLSKATRKRDCGRMDMDVRGRTVPGATRTAWIGAERWHDIETPNEYSAGTVPNRSRPASSTGYRPSSSARLSTDGPIDAGKVPSARGSSKIHYSPRLNEKASRSQIYPSSTPSQVIVNTSAHVIGSNVALAADSNPSVLGTANPAEGRVQLPSMVKPPSVQKNA